MKYGIAELKVPAVVTPQIDTTAASASSTTAGEHMQTLDIVREQLVLLAVTFRPASSQMRLGSEKPQSIKLIRVRSPDTATDLMTIQDAKPVEPASFYPCMKHP